MKMGLVLIPVRIIIPIGLVVIILIVLSWILYTKNRRMLKDLLKEKRKLLKYAYKIKELEEISSKEPIKRFVSLNKLARDFFKDYYNLSRSKTYLELEKHFKKQKENEKAKFCRMMSEADYSGKKFEESEIKELIELFYKIFEENQRLYDPPSTYKKFSEQK